MLRFFRSMFGIGALVGVVVFAALPARAGEEAAARPAFAQSPKVEKEGEAYAITFAVESECDATVWIAGPGAVNGAPVLRHLASGRLGANAPEPFRKGELAQRIAWDGKDDRGRPVPAGCTVHVGLGLGAGFSRMLYQMEQGVAARGPACIACDAKGTLYVTWGHMRSGNLGGITVNISAFDRDGNFLRTVMPFRSDWPEEKISAVEFLKTADGRRVPLTGPNKHSPFIGFLPGVRGVARHNAQVTSDGQLIFPSGSPVADAAGVSKYRLLSLGTDGSCPGKLYVGPELHEGATAGEKFLALSPDGKHLYLSKEYHAKKKKRSHCVYRMSLDGKEPEKPFVGVECEAGDDNKHFRDPRGIATDAAGRLYVCDYENDRIQIFSPAGEHLKTVALPGPEQIVVHPKTGALYVISIGDRGTMDTFAEKRWEVYADKTLVKYASFDDPREVARLAFPKRPRYFHDCGPMLALDPSDEKPVLWVCSVTRGAESEFLWKIVDEGAELKSVPHKVQGQEKWAGTECPSVAAAHDVGEFYLAGGALDGALRVKAGAGEVEEFPLPKGAADWFGEIGAGPEGMLYLSCGKLINPPKDMRWVIRRYSREGNPVAFAKREGIETLGYHAGTYSGEKSGPFDVAPDGTIYVSECAEPGGKARARVNVYGPDGELRKEGLISEATHTAPPLAVGTGGCLYVADAIKSVGEGPGKEFPAFLGTDPRGHFRFWYGTVFMFGPEGGAFRHVEPDAEYTHIGGYPSASGRVVVEGARWEHYGMSPMPQSSTCECKAGRIDADGFGRVFVPDVCTQSVRVLDPAGNLLLCFGEYANWDAQGPASAVPKPEVPLYYPISVAALDNYAAVSDSLNRRVVEVALSHKAEESAPVP